MALPTPICLQFDPYGLSQIDVSPSCFHLKTVVVDAHRADTHHSPNGPRLPALLVHRQSNIPFRIGKSCDCKHLAALRGVYILGWDNAGRSRLVANHERLPHRCNPAIRCCPGSSERAPLRHRIAWLCTSYTQEGRSLDMLRSGGSWHSSFSTARYFQGTLHNRNRLVLVLVSCVLVHAARIGQRSRDPGHG